MPHPERGASLLSALILAVVVGIGVVVTTTMLKQNQDLVNKTRDAVRLKAVRRHVSARLDCDATMAVASCKANTTPRSSCGGAGGAALDLKDLSGATFLPNAGGKIGKVDVRACCSAMSSHWDNQPVPKLLVEARARSGSPWEELFDSDDGENPCDHKAPSDLEVVRSDIVLNPMVFFTEMAGCISFYNPSIGNEIYLPVGAALACPKGLKAVGASLDCRNVHFPGIYYSAGNQLHPGTYTAGMSISSASAGYGFCCSHFNPAIFSFALPYAQNRAELYCVP